MFVTHKRLLLSISLIAALLLAAKGTPADEPAPTKAEAKVPARIFLDQAKTLRLAKLLGNLYVLEELNVSDDAFAQLEDVKGQELLVTRRQEDELNRELQVTADLPVAERRERMRDFMHNFQAAKMAVAETLAIQRFNLLTGSQIERLNQLDLQDQGIEVVYVEDVTAALKLSDDQQKRIEAIRIEFRAKFLPVLHLGYSESYVMRSSRPAVIELLRERTAKVEQVLNPDQREKLDDLRGQPFALPFLGDMTGETPEFDLSDNRVSSSLQLLLAYDAVRKDIQLSPENDAAISVAFAKHQRSLQAIMGNRDQVVSDEKLSAVQRTIRKEDRANYQRLNVRRTQRDLAQELSKHLSDSQLARLKQINWQRGLRNNLGPEGRELLGLTAEQMQKANSIQLEATRQQMTARTPPVPRDPSEFQVFLSQQKDKRNKLFRQQEAQLIEVLTLEQREKFKELQGTPFDVALLDAPRSLAAKPTFPAAQERSKP